jgi:predicted nucleic acid-binding protein
VIYLDTSAFIKLYFREEGSDFVQRCVIDQDEPLPVWEILEVELINACRLKAFWGDITAAQADRQIGLFEQRMRRGQYYVPEVDRGALMSAFRTLARQTPRLGCRTMDILHVACALQLLPAHFLSYDDRQRSLAAHVGLSVLPKTCP